MRHLVLRKLLVTCLAIVVLCGAAGAAGAMAASHTPHRPVKDSAPQISGQVVSGQTLHLSHGRWSGAHRFSFRWQRCNATGAARCHVVIRKGHKPHPATGRAYTLRPADVGHRIRVLVAARNSHGMTSAHSHVTAVIMAKRAATAGSVTGSKTSPSPTTTPTTTSATPAKPGTDPNPKLMRLVPSSGNGSLPAGIPRSDAECAAAVTPTGEKRPSNVTANHTVPSNPSAIQWGSGWDYWPKFVATRKLVTGDFEGTTAEIIQWTACKWGLPVNEAYAEAWLESGWYMSTKSGCPGPESSFGLFQIVAEDCNGNVVHGGYPYVAQDSALNADYWGAWIRACFDGAFLSSEKPWQASPAKGYDGESMAKIIAADGEDYALYGCVGAWLSNDWYSPEGRKYVNTVKHDEQTKLWLQPNT